MESNQVSTVALVLIAVVPVVAGAVLTALFGYLAQRRIDRRDHTRWLKEKRYQAYSEFLTASSELRDVLDRGDPRPAAMRRWTQARERAALVSVPWVYDEILHSSLGLTYMMDSAERKVRDRRTDAMTQITRVLAPWIQQDDPDVPDTPSSLVNMVQEILADAQGKGREPPEEPPEPI